MNAQTYQANKKKVEDALALLKNLNPDEMKVVAQGMASLCVQSKIRLKTQCSPLAHQSEETVVVYQRTMNMLDAYQEAWCKISSTC